MAQHKIITPPSQPPLLLTMYLPCFVFLFLLLTVTCAADSNDSENAVTCGSVVKIQQIDTSYFLNSENKNLNAGSGQQIVTFVSDLATQNTLWWIRPADHSGTAGEYPATVSSCQLAEPIQCGSMIRLTHQLTKRNLHSHAVESVLSKQQEVTAFGQGDGMGDGGDDWKVICSTNHWIRGEPVRLQHKDTGYFLGTAKTLEFNRETCGSHCPIMNHLECFARKDQDSHSLLKTEMGIHLSK